MQFRACGCVVSYRFEIGLRDLEIGIGTEVGFSNRRDVEISPFLVVKRLDEIAPTSAGPNHVRFRIQKAQKVGCDSEMQLPSLDTPPEDVGGVAWWLKRA